MRKLCYAFSEIPFINKIYSQDGQFDWDRMWTHVEAMTLLLVSGVM